jgi:hypothetical protein
MINGWRPIGDKCDQSFFAARRRRADGARDFVGVVNVTF